MASNLPLKEAADRSVVILWVLQMIIVPWLWVNTNDLREVERRATDDRLLIRQEIQAQSVRDNDEIGRKLERIDDRLGQIQRDQSAVIKDMGTLYANIIEKIEGTRRKR